MPMSRSTEASIRMRGLTESAGEPKDSSKTITGNSPEYADYPVADDFCELVPSKPALRFSLSR